MATPVFGSAGTYYFPAAAGTTAAIPVPSGVASGHVIIVFLYKENANPVTSIPTGFTEITQTAPLAQTTGNVQYVHAFWKRATAADSGTYTFGWSGSVWRTGVALRFTGVIATGSPIDVSDTNGRSSAGTSTPAVTVTTLGTERLLVWSGSLWNSTTWTPPSGFTERVDGQHQGVATRDWPTSSNTGSVVGSSADSDYQTAWLIALKPAVTVTTLTATGLGSGVAVGEASLTPGAVTLSATGIPHTHLMGSPSLVQVLSVEGIPSALVFGMSAVDGALRAQGIPSAQAFGIATVQRGPVTLTGEGIPEPFPRFGTAVLLGSVLAPTGIPRKGTTFGTPTINRGPRTLSPVGIAHTHPFGFASISLFTSALTTEVLVRPKPRVSYDLVMVAKIPQPSGPPIFMELESLPWTTIKYGQKLSSPDTLDTTIRVSTLTEGMKQRLRAPSEIPTELWLYRNGKRVFAGPMAGGSMNDDELTLSANGLLSYLQLMYIRTDLVRPSTEQFVMVRTLIDQWQNEPYGNFGITTSGSNLSGVSNNYTFIRNELNIVYDRVIEMGKSELGFDIDIDPESRALNLYYPFRGVDRSESAGPEAVVFDDRNVTNTNITFAVGPNDLATDVAGLGTGTGQNADKTWFAQRVNDELMAKFGRIGLVRSFSNATSQLQVIESTQALLDSRAQTLWIPGPNVRVTSDSDLDTYEVGDTVSYHLHNELDIQGSYRLLGRLIDVDENSNESVSATFV